MDDAARVQNTFPTRSLDQRQGRLTQTSRKRGVQIKSLGGTVAHLLPDRSEIGADDLVAGEAARLLDGVEITAPGSTPSPLDRNLPSVPRAWDRRGHDQPGVGAGEAERGGKKIARKYRIGKRGDKPRIRPSR